MAKSGLKVVLLALLFFLSVPNTSSGGGPLPQGEGAIPVKDMVTLVDLGARSCIPCKMMAPILEELQVEYKGKAAIIFIDVWKEKEKAKKFKISLIPTQIFYDKAGGEVFRHVGFMDKISIKKQLDKLLNE